MVGFGETIALEIGVSLAVDAIGEAVFAMVDCAVGDFEAS
jgi:hypothetical protein